MVTLTLTLITLISRDFLGFFNFPGDFPGFPGFPGIPGISRLEREAATVSRGTRRRGVKKRHSRGAEQSSDTSIGALAVRHSQCVA